MECSERDAGRIDDRIVTTTKRVLNERIYFFDNVLIVLLMTLGFLARRDLIVEPTLGIDRVDGKDFDLTGFDMIFDRIDEIESLIFEIICGSRRKH